MSRRWKIFFLLILMLLHHSLCEGQQKGTGRYSAGGLFSLNQCGIAFTFDDREYLFSEIVLAADLTGVVPGQVRRPGIRAEYYRNYILRELQVPEMQMDLYAGMGGVTGYVMDYNSPMGLLAGISGTIGVRMRFQLPVEIRFGFSGSLAAHAVFSGKVNQTLILYRNGLINLVYPRININYRF